MQKALSVHVHRDNRKGGRSKRTREHKEICKNLYLYILDREMASYVGLVIVGSA